MKAVHSHFIKMLAGMMIAGTFVSAALAEEPKFLRLTLTQAVDLALKRNPQAIICDERVALALARISENAAPLLPQLRGTVSENRQTRDMRGMGLSLPGETLIGPFNTFDARIKLTQAIFDPASLSRLKASRQGHVLSLAQQKKAKEDVLVLVAGLFIEAKRGRDAVKVSFAALCRDKKVMSIEWANLQTGMGSTLELKKSRAVYAGSLNDFETAKKEELERRLDLLAALDLPQDQNVVLEWDEALLAKPVPLANGLDNQSDVKLAREQLKLDEKDREAVRRDLWPRIFVSGDFGNSGMSLKPEESSETYTLGVSATIPIYEGGSTGARIKEKDRDVQISRLQLKDVENTVRARQTVQEQVLSQAEFFLDQNVKNVDVAEEEMRLADTKWKTGNGSVLDLTTARVNLKNAADRMDEAVAFKMLAKINLARSRGCVAEFLKREQD